MIDDKILARIQALLAMGNDTSSEHEASIAMRRARKLMDKYQLDTTTFTGVLADDLGSSEYDTGLVRLKPWIEQLAIAVADLNDCVISYFRTSGTGHYTYIFEGFNQDVSLTKWMLRYLVETCDNLYLKNKGILGLYGLADKNDFLNGLVDNLVVLMDKIKRDREKAQTERGHDQTDDKDFDKSTSIEYEDKKDDFDESLALGYESSCRDLAIRQHQLIVAKKAIVVAEFGESDYGTRYVRDSSSDAEEGSAYDEGSRLAKQIHLEGFVEGKNTDDMPTSKRLIR